LLKNLIAVYYLNYMKLMSKIQFPNVRNILVQAAATEPQMDGMFCFTERKMSYVGAQFHQTHLYTPLCSILCGSSTFMFQLSLP